MSQVFQKTYDCLTCGKQIRLSKIDNPGPNEKKHWLKYEVDGRTIHKCGKREVLAQVADEKEEKIEPPPMAPSQKGTGVDKDYDAVKEISQIRANLLLLSNRLERLERELSK
jgi:hypothetical protein